MFSEQDPSQEFTRLYRSCEAWLYHYLLSLLRRPEDAEEVLQETAKVCWEKFDRYQRNLEFRAWACQIAHFKALNFRQQRKKAPLSLSDLFFTKVNEEAVVLADKLDANLAALEKCIQRLPAADRRLLELRYAPKGTSKFAAEVLGHSLDMVYRGLSRIYRLLYYCIRQTMGEEEGA
jgi:RNA polymerase sigma-70 factor, ECF subfamily